MSPRARLIVSYTRPDGEIVADAMDFEVEGFLSNNLEISMDKAQSFPGDWKSHPIFITVIIKPYS